MTVGDGTERQQNTHVKAGIENALFPELRIFFQRTLAQVAKRQKSGA